ncbi:uncharacterized protein F5147DRAFT_762421 [Suillus discolor]|uniref:Uncharacterized protein n=1 Tax=Suillus discolor TaxID=1912936 RepID=A0A9P7JRV0_9AGAM|nr:uncharacterized protein F5147DRAFT_762421 [Suillus discolor]KAG2103153.1 hypothetical protein F5147DRAFT_762421 [Suillus discolor]
MLGVILITRLHVMYQRSRKILIFLIVTFLAVNIFDGVVAIMTAMQTSGEGLITSGAYQCSISYGENIPLLNSVSWTLFIVWEVLALCLAVWVVVKHLREQRLPSVGEDCLIVLMKTHMLYFARIGRGSFVAVSCFELIIDFLQHSQRYDQNFMETEAFYGLLQILQVVQMVVLGPRLILSVREYYARLVADPDAATGMTSIVFQERVHISTGSSVVQLNDHIKDKWNVPLLESVPKTDSRLVEIHIKIGRDSLLLEGRRKDG